MGFSISVDWSNYIENGWVNTGRSLVEENCTHKAEDSNDTNMRYSGYCEKCGQSEDSCEPMMNYAYPLETTPDDKAILKVCKDTNCTVMYNTEEDKHYLALCGGGMDLSQCIAMAYFIIEKWIPLDLALQVCTQPNISQYGKNFRKVMRACKDSIKKDIDNGRFKIKEINRRIKESLAKEKK